MRTAALNERRRPATAARPSFRCTSRWRRTRASPVGERPSASPPCPVTIPAIADAVGPLAIGQDPTDIEAVAEDLRRRYQNMMRGGPARFALSAIEIAMWDIKGKVEGKPIWQLLGGAARESIEAYASMFRYHEPAVVKQIAAAAWQRGYRKIKLHERTVEAVAAAREALGSGVPLMVDVNCAWYPDEAISMAQQMQPYDIAWLEEPVSPPDDYDGLARVRREGGVPIANGENIGNPYDVRWMAARGAVDIVQPSVVKHGGISDIMRMVEIAEGAGMRAVPHCPFRRARPAGDHPHHRRDEDRDTLRTPLLRPQSKPARRCRRRHERPSQRAAGPRPGRQPGSRHPGTLPGSIERSALSRRQPFSRLGPTLSSLTFGSLPATWRICRGSVPELSNQYLKPWGITIPSCTPSSASTTSPSP